MPSTGQPSRDAVGAPGGGDGGAGAAVSAIALFALLVWAPWEDIEKDGCAKLVLRLMAMIVCIAFAAGGAVEAVTGALR